MTIYSFYWGFVLVITVSIRVNSFDLPEEDKKLLKDLNITIPDISKFCLKILLLFF